MMVLVIVYLYFLVLIFFYWENWLIGFIYEYFKNRKVVVGDLVVICVKFVLLLCDLDMFEMVYLFIVDL